MDQIEDQLDPPPAHVDDDEAHRLGERNGRPAAPARTKYEASAADGAGVLDHRACERESDTSSPGSSDDDHEDLPLVVDTGEAHHAALVEGGEPEAGLARAHPRDERRKRLRLGVSWPAEVPGLCSDLVGEPGDAGVEAWVIGGGDPHAFEHTIVDEIHVSKRAGTMCTARFARVNARKRVARTPSVTSGCDPRVMAIACVYCGGTHATAAGVKQCWERGEGQSGQDQGRAPVVAPSTGHGSSPRRQEPAVVAGARSHAREVVVAHGIGRGPHQLGRNVIVAAENDEPAEWNGCERIRIDSNVVDEPLPTVERLRSAAVERRGVVIELVGDTAAPAVEHRPIHELGARFALDGDELRHLTWSNSIDGRDPAAPSWWLVDRAVALGATFGGAADIVLPDGTVAWLDGGPVRFTDPVEGVPVLHAVAVEHGSLAPPVSNVSGADVAADQLAAVVHAGGAARIIAPAGSGKTRVLTERARHLLVGWRLPPSAVSLVAFNKRAQEEMRERTADLPGLQVRTLNAIALAIVNGVSPFLAQPRSWRTIDEPDVRRVLSKLIGFPKRRNTDPVAPWIEALSAIRLGLLDPLDVERRYGGDVDGLTDVWPRYRAELERERAIDFDDQIYRAIEVLVGQPDARAAAQRACRLMLVDEFQDLTPAHLLLVRLLSAPGGAVFGVGDDDQTIYGYNGADPAWLIDFGTLFPGAGDHPLEVNYRCPAGIVEAVDRLLRHNRRRVSKTMRASALEPGGWSVETSDDPVASTVAAVEVGLTTGAAPADVAVLTRVNALLAPVQLALVAAGIPVAGGVGLEFADRTSVRAVLAWLRLTTGRAAFTSDDLGEALRRPSRPLHPRVAEWVAEQSDVAALRRLAGRLNAERDTERVSSFADDIERLRKLADGGASTAALVEVLLDDIGLAGAVQTLDATRHGMNRSAQGDDLAAIRHLAAQHDDAQTFERWLRAGLATPREPGGVVLATVHRVKGQEWLHVVVHLADADQYPHRLADDVEEERRLLHVAIHACPPPRHDRHQPAPEPVHRRAHHRTPGRARRGAADAWTRRAGTAPQGRGRGRSSAARSVDRDRGSRAGARRPGQRMGRLRVRRPGRRRRPGLGDEALPGRLAGGDRRSAAR